MSLLTNDQAIARREIPEIEAAILRATAGSGKTFMLFELVTALSEAGWDPANILVTTFGRLATASIEEKFKSSLITRSANVSTLNAFAFRMVKTYGSTIGMDSFEIVQSGQSMEEFVGILLTKTNPELMTDLYKTFSEHDPLSSKHFGNVMVPFMQGMVEYFDQMGLQANMMPTDIMKEIDVAGYWYVEDQQEYVRYFLHRFGRTMVAGDGSEAAYSQAEFVYEILSKVYFYLHVKKTESRIIDHNDVVYSFYRILKESRFIAGEIAKTFQILIVDEYQDTNKIQTLIAKLIPFKKRYMVGDYYQSIYGFNGSRNQLFKAFSTDYSAPIYQLYETFRCHQAFCDFANKVIEHTTDNDPVFYVPMKSKSSAVLLGFKVTDITLSFSKKDQGYTLEDLSEMIHTDVLAILATGAEPKEIMVISRYNINLMSLAGTVNKRYKFHCSAGDSIFETKIGKFLRTIYHFVFVGFTQSYNPMIVRPMISYFREYIPEKTIKILYRMVNDLKSPAEIIKTLVFSNEVPRQISDLFSVILKNYQNRVRTSNTKYAEIANELFGSIAGTNLEEVLTMPLMGQAENHIREVQIILKTTIDSIAKFDKVGDDAKQFKLFEYLYPKSKSAEKPGVNVVQMMSIHKAKGLEAKYVIMIADAKLPGKTAYSEESNIFYVGSTRAKSYLSLYLTRMKKDTGKYPIDDAIKAALSESIPIDYRSDHEFGDEAEVEIDED